MIAWNTNLRHLLSVTFLFVLVFGALYLCYVIGRPFLNAVLIAFMLAVLFHPLHSRISKRFRRANLVATLCTLLVFLVAAIPVAVLGFVLNEELRNLIRLLHEQNSVAASDVTPLARLRESVVERFGGNILVSPVDLRAALLHWTEQANNSLLSFGARVVANLFSFLFETIVVFVSLFYFFREGSVLRQKFFAMLPLRPEQTEALANRISETMIANLHGGLAVGAAQGFLTGLSFWMLGISAPILWALITGLASFVPVVGSALVWGPAVLLLALAGHWVKALILTVWGVAIVGQIDVLVRPYVLGTRMKLHSLLIFFALLGGVEAFGIIGIFLGPLIVSVALALLDTLKTLDVPWQTDSVGPPPLSSDVKRS